MQITIDIPDKTMCINIAIVYESGIGQISMGALLQGSPENGEMYYLPKERKPEEK